MHFVPHDDFAFVVPVRDVEELFVGRERDPVRSGQFGRQQLQLAVVNRKNAAKRKLFPFVVEKLRQAERGIGEEQRSVGAINEIVGTVQSLAVIPVCDYRERAVRLEPCNAPVAMLADRKPPLRIESEAVRSRLAVLRDVRTRITARLTKNREVSCAAI